MNKTLPHPVTHFPASNQNVSILGVLIPKREGQLLDILAKSQNWTLFLVESLAEGRRVTEEHRITTVLLNRYLLGVDWRDVLHLFLQPAHRSNVLLVTSTPGDPFCKAFVEEGGYGVLPWPPNEAQLIDTVQHAWSHWKTSVAGPYGY